MKEVSCRAVEPFLEAADREGIPRAALIAGLPYELAHLANRHEYVEWDAFRAFMRNASTYWDDAALRRIGERGLLEGPGVRAFALIGRTVASPSGFYRWLLASGGMGNRIFANMVPTFRELGPGHFSLSLLLTPGYDPCPEFFRFAAGGFEAIPQLVGLTRATVTLTDVDRGALFDIRFDDRPSWRGKLVRLLTRPTDARATAAELDDALRTLERRYAELTATRNAVTRQNALLDIAYRVGARLWHHRDPTTTAAAIATALVEIAGFPSAAVDVAPVDQPDAREQASAGAGPRPRRVPLPRDGRVVGELQLGLLADPEATQTLLDLLVPTCALALENAFASRAVADYQRTLEAQVASRTAELRAALDKLAATVRALEEARDARERIFANISHEIRTPLSLILLTIADLDQAGAGGARAAAAIESSARKLLRLVDELLLLAAGQAHGLNLRVEALDVAALAGALIDVWRPAAHAAGLDLTLTTAPHCTAVADPTALDRMIANLVSNAIKFTPRGGHVAVDVGRRGDALTITVRDDGRGIDDDLFRRLFGRFEQAHGPSGARGGSGIGLSLVRELAVAHGGEVAVERLAPGTAFTITLPASDHPDAAVRAPELRPSDFGIATPQIRSGDVIAPPAEPGKTSPTILVAEDDPALATSIARVLGGDYTIVVALDGATALDLAARHQPHLLVTDVEMPGMDGIELTRRFRALPGNGLAPVLMLSARADLRDRISGLDAGALDYVVKPFEPQELRARVRAQLEMRNLATRLHRTEKLAALGSLSAGLAHELRNPANGIVNAIAPLRELLPPELARGDAPTAQLLDVLTSCAEQIGFLSKQLLGFRRGGDLEMRTTPLGDVVERSLALLRPALRGVDLRQRLGYVGPVKCAPPLLVQVLTNLIENGIHAAGPGGWVEITSAATARGVAIEIADSGPGVPQLLRERIFEPFFTTKPPGAGTGLGLAVARDIIQRHGGILEVRTRGERTVFALELPQRPAPEPA